MTWTKLGDEFPAAAWGLTGDEFRTHVEALCWSNFRLLDLYVPKDEVRRFAASKDFETAVGGLVAKGWWEDRGDIWYIGLKFPEWQLEGAVVERRRQGSALRMRRSRMHKAGDHSICLPGNCPDVARNMTRNVTRAQGRDGTGPTDPPVPEEQDQDQDQNQPTSAPLKGARSGDPHIEVLANTPVRNARGGLT